MIRLSKDWKLPMAQLISRLVLAWYLCYNILMVKTVDTVCWMNLILKGVKRATSQGPEQFNPQPPQTPNSQDEDKDKPSIDNTPPRDNKTKRIKPDWRSRLLSVITNPNIAYVLMLLLVAGILFSAFRVLREYERGVIFFLGRFQAIQKMVRVDLRVITMDIPPQDVISKDNVTVHVSAVLYFRVVDAERAIIQVEDYYMATSQLAQTTLRSVLGQHDLDEMLSQRDKLNEDIQSILDEQTASWGIKVTNVEIKHIDLDESMIRAIAKQAEAERERRAKVIHAEGELEASEKLLGAANVIATNPQALQLRYLQTLSDISTENTTTIVFPLPLDMINVFMKQHEKETKN
ncbi:hypothetical protein GQR58_010557 [Nymphon striatum]|nr:hypothetical protein GQR58_010557 [Nymphon striatum]